MVREVSSTLCRLGPLALPLTRSSHREHRCIMARVTVEDCLEQVENRFALVMLGTARARDLRKGQAPIFTSENKEAVHALREIASGYVRFDDASRARLKKQLGASAGE